MKHLIKKLLREGLVNELRVSLNDLGKYVLIYLREDEIFLLIDKEDLNPVGYIAFSLTDGDVYGIYGAYANRGFGPLLYELVMTQVYPKGITMSDDSNTSDDALHVWQTFYDRGDVEKKEIIRSKSTEKEELLNRWTEDGFYDDEYGKVELERIIKLHYTQFIFNLGKDKLDELIRVGDEFKANNPDLNYMGMVYSLEK